MASGAASSLRCRRGAETDTAGKPGRGASPGPTCGAKQICDGSFSKRLSAGQGRLAAALQAQGIPLLDVEDLDQSTAL